MASVTIHGSRMSQDPILTPRIGLGMPVRSAGRFALRLEDGRRIASWMRGRSEAFVDSEMASSMVCSLVADMVVVAVSAELVVEGSPAAYS